MIEPHVIVDDPAKLVVTMSIVPLCDGVVFVGVGLEHKRNHVSLQRGIDGSQAIIMPDDEQIPFPRPQAKLTFVMPFMEYATYCDGDKYRMSFFVTSMEFAKRVGDGANYLREEE